LLIKGGPTRSNMQPTMFPPAFSHTHCNMCASFTSSEPCVPKISISQAPAVSVGSRVTPYAQTPHTDNGSGTTPKSTGFTFPPACSKSAILSSSTTSPSLFGTPYAQKQKEDNGSDTTPKSTGFTFPPPCSKSAIFCSSTTSPGIFGTPSGQTPQANNGSDTARKSTCFPFPPACSKSANLCSSTSSPGMFGTPYAQKPKEDNRSARLVTPYAHTPQADSDTGAKPVGNQLGERGGPKHSNMQSASFTFAPAINHTHANPVSSFTSTEPCAANISISQTPSVYVGSRVTPYAQTPHTDNGSDTTKSTGFTSLPAFRKLVNPCSSSTSTSLFGTPNPQTPQADTSSGTKPAGIQLGERGVRNCDGQSSGEMASNTNNTESTQFTFAPAFSQIHANPFTSSTSTSVLPKTSNIFTQKKTSTDFTPFSNVHHPPLTGK
ncbi:hypothetical protein Tco_1308236, partial [Tanacetum coccineum]